MKISKLMGAAVVGAALLLSAEAMAQVPCYSPHCGVNPEDPSQRYVDVKQSYNKDVSGDQVVQGVKKIASN